MSSLTKDSIFPYHWYIDGKEKDVTCIRVYGIGQDGSSKCLRIDDFTPYAYIELPSNIEWTTSKAQLVCNKIDEMMGEKCPLKKVLMQKKKLYGAHINSFGKRKLFPYLFCSFSKIKAAKV